MGCPRCGSENPEGQRFCGNCGTALASTCGSCGSSNPPGQRFCGSCGAALTGGAPALTTPAAAASAIPTTERRLVSILFADLVGFTTLSESRDPEEVRELLSRYFDESRRIVERYAGVVEKFIGDAVMAVWGSPIAHEDDAERAVRAALELTAFVRDLGAEVGAPDLRARAGVLTGEAAVNLDAKDQGMVAGDLVNTASRIQSVAAAGTVLVGESTMRTTDRVIAYEPAGSHELKGKDTPVELYRATRVVGLRRASGRATFLEPPFTGRDRELRMIKELFHDAAEHSRVHLVSVQGVAGIGKSRLVWELNKYIDGLVEDVWWHQGRCLAYGEGVTFWALAEMVRGRAGILEDEESSSALAKLTTSVDEHIADPSERRFVRPRLAHLLGLEERGLGDQENLFAACRIFFERIADRGPSVMVFEDIHWADSALLDFIGYLAEWSRDRPIFLMTLARPELVERRPTWGSQTRNFTSIFLEPLPSDEMSSLLSDPIPGLPEELRERILERAEGIPFYAVETVRMLIDRGLLVRDDAGGFRLTGSVETLEVPESLHALIAARLDGLEPAERRLLQDAAVLGRTFTKQGLVAITGLPDGEVADLLGSLVRKEVLSISIDPLLSDRGQYGFLQDLVKKVAYDTMSRRERKARHVAAAAYLRSAVDEDEIVEVVASHLLDAYLAAPDGGDAEAIRRDAFETLGRASERAASLGANVEAQRYAERAIELASDPRAAAELHERAGMMAVLHADVEPGVEHFRTAIELFEAEGAKLPAARVSARLGDALWVQGKGADALELMESAYGVLADEEPNSDLAQLAAQLGRFSYFAGDDAGALERIDRALEIAEALDIPETLSESLNTKALIIANDSRWNEADALLQHALAIGLQHDKPSAALRAYNNLVDFAVGADRFADADQLVQEGLAFARRVGNRYWEFSLLGHVSAKYSLGRWDELMASLEEIPPEEFVRARLGFNQGYVAFGTGVEVHRGDVEAARRRLERFGEMQRSADVQEQAEWAVGSATLALAEDDPKEALRFAENAIAHGAALSMGHFAVKESIGLALEAALRLEDREKIGSIAAMLQADPIGRRRLSYRAHVARAEAGLPDRPDDEAERLFEEAIAAFGRIEMRFRLAVTLLEYGEWLTERGRATDAEPAVAEARSLFEGLGARPWIDRADAVTSLSASRG